ncbi:hypothetical protein WH47_10528 [Habropoda laboriosa]|uniref:PiggyBac transposable element-derived protein domain-containing protein n=1 Tax=Habropoda laboriosa TaxID=597456 RepID=A0A0L7QN00_9HYME|nr:hypothetical protein WH47_10528 [Habropoda laboriosa]
MKSKKAKYGIKFFELRTPDGYVLNIEIYKGKTNMETNVPKIQSLVLRLLDPYLYEGHRVFMDNFYNSVETNSLYGHPSC